MDAVDELVDRGRRAMQTIDDWDQAAVDNIVRAVAWAIYEPDRARELAELAVADTGLGNVADKISKNQRKTVGTLRDLLRMPSVGRVGRDEGRGLTMYAKPVGVVAAVTPSTNPGATVANKIMMAVNGANAVVVAPSPAGWSTAERLVEMIHVEFDHIGAPHDLVQLLPQPVSIEATETLMNVADLVVVTGAQHNVRSAYRSGTPAIGVGAGNVPVIIDETADLDIAAALIAKSKTFDNATSCSAENSLVIVDEVYDEAIAALERCGARLVSPSQGEQVSDRLFPDGKLNRAAIGQDIDRLADLLGVENLDGGCRFLLVEQDRPGPDRPLTREKLSLVTAVFRARDVDHASELVGDVLAVQGVGHSVGIHTNDRARAEVLAASLPVVRVLVNQAHAVGNGGSFDNGMPFSLSMGCGTWQGNSISENLNGKHFINTTYLVETIPPDQPTEAELFEPYWSATGRS